ncbi:MAG: galactokinase [Flavobacteriales bacterium]|nr:galactokinase [Flavobacteriales bacterium]MCB9191320.1 galactokinase [Flavobacteriales bacterium]MCB9204327.1 galactokinase [Flavobacteriales bacterium]
MLERNAQFFQLFGTGDDPQAFFCPGRVNLIGEHIDYLGGYVMPAAISLGITGLIRPSQEQSIRLASTSFEGITELDLNSLPEKKRGQWSDYVLGVIHAVRKEGIEIGGFELLLDSTLPKGSGLSSSAALEVLAYFMLHSVFGKSMPDRTTMATACQRVENEFIGVQCGIMDQFAVANGKAKHAMLLNCSTLEVRNVPLNLGKHTLVIIDSKKPRKLAESAYNQRRKECDNALEIISDQRILEQLVDATETDLQLLSDPILKKRTRHAYSEQNRVLEAESALQKGDLRQFGKLLTASHLSLRNDFEVSCTELDFIVDFLINSEFCLGARMTGAGFGGCCIALLKSENANELCNALDVVYSKRFGFSPECHICETANGVHSVT